MYVPPRFYGEYHEPSCTLKKTWKFHAINVHDFAWTADPTYRIGETFWNGIRCVALAQESSAPKWQTASEYASRVIELYSRDFGMYAWPKIIVADAQDGMEYPMLTLDRGAEPGFHGLFAHEIGHMWFFGMVGNNETYRAALDEGFTQFLTTWGVSHLDGDTGLVTKNKNKYVEEFTERRTVRDNQYMAYLSDAITNNDPPINTHSDQFNGALEHGGGYRHVYYKTATMLFNLQYVLGDTLFQNAMKHYFNQWKFCHPYFEDFRASIIQYTHADLNWFFDEWMETNKNIDYRITRIKKLKAEDQYQVTFKRKGRMQMPIDFTVYSKDDSTSRSYYIPNTWFEKKTSATVLPRWIGWDKLQQKYTATVSIPNGFGYVTIDTSGRLADVYMPNNSSRMNLNFNFDAKIANSSDWKNYEMKARPDLWYNSRDGFKTGIHLNGNYMRTFHVFEATIWINTGLAQEYEARHEVVNYNNLSYRFTYSTTLYKLSKNTNLNFSARNLDGLKAYSLGFEKKNASQKLKYFMQFKSMRRHLPNDLYYLLYPKEWELDEWNNSNTYGLIRSYSEGKTNGNVSLALTSSTVGSDNEYSYVTLSHINRSTLGRFDFKSRLFGRYGITDRIPNESALFLAGASPEEMMENKFLRSRGFVDETFLGYGSESNHLQAGGGLNLRGYAGYLAVEKLKNGKVVPGYKGTSGASASVELGFDRFFPFKPKMLRDYIGIDMYLFGDAGTININPVGESLTFGEIRADAGLGASFIIKKFGPLQTVNPLTIRFDMPLFLNRPPATDKDYFQFRWLLGVSRAF